MLVEQRVFMLTNANICKKDSRDKTYHTTAADRVVHNFISGVIKRRLGANSEVTCC